MLSKIPRYSAISILARRSITRASAGEIPFFPWKGNFSHGHSFLSSQANAGQDRRFSASPLDEETKTTNFPREKSIEEKYSKKTPLEHVLLRPGMYVGPVERLPPSSCWVLDPQPEPYDFSSQFEKGDQHISNVQSFRMTNREYGLVPALIKIFDEILVNATDNRLRDPKACTKLDVRIDPGTSDREPRIQIWNNGKGVPIHMHTEEKMYVPELVFGHLLTGSNFDDDEKRLTGKQPYRTRVSPSL